MTQTTRHGGSVFEEGRESTAPPELAETLVNRAPRRWSTVADINTYRRCVSS